MSCFVVSHIKATQLLERIAQEKKNVHFLISGEIHTNILWRRGNALLLTRTIIMY